MRQAIEKKRERRYVRVELDFLVDVGRDFMGDLPFELHGIETNRLGFIQAGLRRCLPRRALVRVAGPSRVRMRPMTYAALERAGHVNLLPATPSAPIKRQRTRAKRARAKATKR